MTILTFEIPLLYVNSCARIVKIVELISSGGYMCSSVRYVEQYLVGHDMSFCYCRCVTLHIQLIQRQQHTTVRYAHSAL